MTTITYQQMNDLAGGGLTEQQMDGIAQYFGYTITPAEPPAEPPAEMVKLAREIAREAVDGGDLYVRVALAALQHVVKKVRRMRDQRIESAAAVEVCDEILTALGAGGRDAG